ncbi:MAG: SPOR domain-containing protein [Saprospiraceae bacterium]
MEIDVGSCIETLLYDNESVSIPGLGAIVSHYQSAVIEPVQGAVHPPSKSLEFNENLVMDDGLLLNLIVEKYGLTRSEVEKIITNYVADVKAAIKRKEFVVFSNVGRLYQNYEGKYQFLPDDTNFNTDSFGLSSVQFYPIIRHNRPVLTTAQTKSNSKSFSVGGVLSGNIADWFQRNLAAFITLAIIVVTVGIWLLVAHKPANENDILSIVPKDRVNISPSELEGGPDNLKEVDEEESNQSLDETNPAVAKATEEPTNSTPEETEGITPNPKQTYALIAIGAFGSQENVERLIKKVYEEGYEPFTRKIGNLTQVGVQVPYDDQAEVNMALQAVRKKFDNKAKIVSE